MGRRLPLSTAHWTKRIASGMMGMLNLCFCRQPRPNHTGATVAHALPLIERLAVRNLLLICILAAILSACASKEVALDPDAEPAEPDSVGMKPAPQSTPAAPQRDVRQLKQEIAWLNAYIGAYPPRYPQQGGKRLVQERWIGAVNDARAHLAVQGDTEEVLFLLAELYRQGHNMDVKNAGALAERTIEACVGKYPQSVPCHFSSSFFYLSVDPKYADRAERSLTTLRKLLAPRIDHSVERGLVFLYVYKKQPAQAIKQINYYLKKFPNSKDKEKMVKLRAAIKKGGIK